MHELPLLEISGKGLARHMTAEPLTAKRSFDTDAVNSDVRPHSSKIAPYPPGVAMAASLAKIEAEPCSSQQRSGCVLRITFSPACLLTLKSKKPGPKRSNAAWLKWRLAPHSCPWKMLWLAHAGRSCEDLPQRSGGA